MRASFEHVATAVWESSRRSRFSGTDPYDALRSTFLSGISRGSRLLRAALTRLVRTCPVDLRRMLGVPTGTNPKAISLFLSSAAERPSLPGSAVEIAYLQDLLLSMASVPGGRPALSPDRGLVEGISSECAEGRLLDGKAIGWGYDFPWQGRAFFQPAFAPTAVVTSFAVRAFERAGSPAAGPVALAAARFVRGSLHRSAFPEGICFSYSPRDATCVYNASLLAAGILLAAARHGGPDAVDDGRLASEACRFVISRQKPDGSWEYGDGGSWSWTDGFHTGFVLESLGSISAELGRDDWLEAVGRGMEFYRRRLFDPEGTAFSAPGRRFPLDPHSFAQGAITFCSREDPAQEDRTFASRILARAVDLLWDGRRGGFIYSRGRVGRNAAIHSRWCQAWMLKAIAEVLGDSTEAQA